MNPMIWDRLTAMATPEIPHNLAKINAVDTRQAKEIDCVRTTAFGWPKPMNPAIRISESPSATKPTKSQRAGATAPANELE